MPYLMTREQKELMTGAWPLCLIGVVLLAFTYITPDAGHQNGMSFIEVARNTAWHQPCDWPAAWCSVKVILLSLGAFFLTLWLTAMFGLSLPKTLERLMVLLMTIPCFGVLAGMYFLVKAVL